MNKKDIDRIHTISKIDYEYKYNDKIYELHNELLEYCNENSLMIYDKIRYTNNLDKFIKCETNLYQNLFNKNLEEEIKDMNNDNNNNDINN